MEIGEIRSAFVESTAIGERLQAFRNERLAKIMGGDTRLGSFVRCPPRSASFDNLLLPEVLIEEYGSRFARYLRHSFDALWQACGHEQDLNYDEDGDWGQSHS